MNCHGPTALDLDTAFVLKPLSTSERKIKSAGRLNSAKTCSTIGRWRSSRCSQSSKRSRIRSEEHTSELQSRLHLVCRLLLEKKKEPSRCRSNPRPQQSRRPGRER